MLCIPDKITQREMIVQIKHVAGIGFIPVNDRIHPEKIVFWF